MQIVFGHMLIAQTINILLCVEDVRRDRVRVANTKNAADAADASNVDLGQGLA